MASATKDIAQNVIEADTVKPFDLRVDIERAFRALAPLIAKQPLGVCRGFTDAEVIQAVKDFENQPKTATTTTTTASTSSDINRR